MTEQAYLHSDLKAEVIKAVCRIFPDDGRQKRWSHLVRAAVAYCLADSVDDSADQNTGRSLGLGPIRDTIERGAIAPTEVLKVFAEIRKTLGEMPNRGFASQTWAGLIEKTYSRCDDAVEEIAGRISKLRLDAKKGRPKKDGRADRIQGQMLKFVSKRAQGWIDVGGTRMCLLDVPSGWLSLAQAIKLFAGEDTYNRVLFEAGQGGTFPGTALERRIITRSPDGFREAVDTFSHAGFGSFQVRELRFSDGFARITCPDAFEAWALLRIGRTVGSAVCHYSTGVLLSFMEQISRRNDITATETKCIAKGDDECEFMVGTREELQQIGIDLPEWGMTIKEKAEYLENLLEENKKVQKEIRRKNLELSALNKISLIVSQSLDLNEILKLAVTELRKIVGEKGVAIFLIDPAKTELILAAQEGFSDEFVESIRQLDINEGLAGRVARERTPMAYDDYTRFPEAIEPAVKTEKIKSLLSVPLMSIDNILGVLNVASKTPYHFTPEEINLMTLIGNQIGPAMERAQLHEEIKESERKYKTLVEDINDGYFVCQKGKIVFANRAFLDMYGRDRDEVLNSDSAKFLPADCVQKISRMARDRMAGKTAPEFLEFARRHKDGRELPTEVKVAFSQFNGRPAMIGMFRDVSERKRMEQQILENERLASIGRVSSILAHEIRNPLSSIKTNIQVLSRKLNLEGFDKKRLEIAHAEIKRLERVLQDMLDFARPMTMKKSAHSIDDIIDKCLALLESSFKSGRISIARKKLRTRKKVLVDGEKMEEALLNILLNSADAMSKGGTIRIATGSARHDGRKAVRIEIQDTGAGIPLDEVDKIFDPFFSTKTGGVGLGLTNVKRIIEAHEGIIEVHSSVNEGTLFAITVPER